MLEICALASGSNGNCYYIGNDTDAVLIDGGIYYKRLIERLEEANLDKSKIKAVFISHEHADHVQGVKAICKKLNITAYFSYKTFNNLPRNHHPAYVKYFEAGEIITVGEISILAFNKKHDAADPCSFRVECEGTQIAVLTDIGIADEQVQQEFGQCQVAFLEANYDKDMLWNGTYPIYIKKRVDSEIGHLSNIQALELVKNHASPHLKYIFLSHISKENNTVELALQTFSDFNGKYVILPTSRDGISEVIRL
jgi:phosphoribosyl 1,2-cyclic phosphodiesterase